MTAEQIKRRFVNNIKLRGFEDKYIDRNEEKEILKDAIDLGAGFDAARVALAQVCDAENYVLESAVYRKAEELLNRFVRDDGKIDEREFNDTVDVCRTACMGKKSDIECKRMVVEVLENHSRRVKTGWFSDWYSKVKQEVGM